MSAHTPIINPAVADLFRRVKELEDPSGGWNGADCVEVLCEWFVDHGINPDGGFEQLVGAGVDAAMAGEPTPAVREWLDDTAHRPNLPDSPDDPGRIRARRDELQETALGDVCVYLVQRETFDGLYLFASEEDRDVYAGLFDGAGTGTATVINRSAAAQLIIDSQPCPACGDQTDRGPCPVGDPECDALDCQNHDSCLTPITTGTGVHLADEDPTDPAGPEVLIGIVADPTDAEASERWRLTEAGARVLVAWPHHRRWEDRADLTAINDECELYR
jgi:hypothetical protein